MKTIYKSVKYAVCIAAAVVLTSLSGYAQVTITEWDFEGDTTVPSTGSGTVSLIGVNATFAGGNPGRAWNTNSYAPQGTESGERGIQIEVSTEDFENIVLTFDHRSSGTGSRWSQVDYSLDGGSTWEVDFWNNSGGLSPHDNFYTFTVDFSSVLGANDNPDFVVRIVSIFSPIAFNQNTSLTYEANEAYMRSNAQAQYQPDPASGTGNYGTSGTWRFDNINVSGDALGVAGCTNAAACNFDPAATVDDNSCLIVGEACDDGDPLTFNDTITAACLCEGQSANFDAHLLSAGDYILNEWAATEPSGNYPTSMRFYWSNDPGSSEYDRTDDGAAEYDCSYNGTSRPRILGNDADGFSFLNTGSPQFNNCSNSTDGADDDRYVGSAVLRLNTTGLSYARAEWLVRTVARNSRDYAIRLQYRLGDTGSYIDFGNETEYSVVGTTDGNERQFSFDLPAVVLDEADVYLRWVYYQLPDSPGGQRAQLGVDDIRITANGCTDPTACNYAEDALADDGSCFFTCNDTPAGATVLAMGALGNCMSISDDLENGLTNVGGALVAQSNDLWYRFTAVTAGARVEVATGDFDALVELRSADLTLVEAIDLAGANSGEVINFGDLVAGDDYLIRIASIDAGSGSREFEVCVQFLPDTRCDFSSGTYSLCSPFKAKWVSGGTNYVFNFTPAGGGETISYATGAAFTVVPLQNVPGLLWETEYELAIDVELVLSNSLGIDEVITVRNTDQCTIDVPQAPTAALRAQDNLVNAGPLFLGAYIAATPWICTTQEWEWEFVNTNGVQLPITHLSGGPSRFVRLLEVPGLQAGDTYEVRVRPVFPTGAPSSYGAVDQIAIVGSLGLGSTTEAPFENDGVEERVEAMLTEGVAIYPNPNRGDFVNVNVSGIASGIDRVLVEVYDLAGKRVLTEQIAAGASNVNVVLPLNGLSSGMYIAHIVVGDNTHTQRFNVQK